MTAHEAFWAAVESCVSCLPHKVEWFEPNATKPTGEIQNTFVIPIGLVEMFGGSQVLYEPCKKLAERHRCVSFFKANDGSLVFKKY